MKGSTHAAIGIAAANIIHPLRINTLLRDPLAILPMMAAYAGSLFCDIDTENSTVSNFLSIVHTPHIKKALTIAYTAVCTGAIMYFRHTEHFKYIVAAVIILSLSVAPVIAGFTRILKKILLYGSAVAISAAGIYFSQPPLILIGILMAVFMLSPHRAYSHSLLGILVCYAVARYTCTYYKLIDFSMFFAIGMLSHVIADMFTNQGVMIFFPYPKKIHFPVTIETGNPLEYGISAVAILVLIASSIIFR